MKPPSRSFVVRRTSSLQVLFRRPATGLRTKKSTQALSQRSPISSLPTEVFLRILEFIRDMNVFGEHWSTFDQWHRISQVCRAWRDIILNSPTLWSHIQASCYPQAKVMFERSRGVTIDVACHMRGRNGLHALAVPDAMSQESWLCSLITDNIHRARTLSLIGPIVMHLLRDVQTSFATSLLEHLSLTLPIDGVVQMATSIEKLFLGATRLRSLALAGIYILPSSSLFTPYLSSLRLGKGNDPGLGVYTLDEVIGMLKCVPSLELLRLGRLISPFSGGEDHTDIAELRSLRSLTFYGTTLLQCALFMQRLSLPRDAAVHLHCVSGSFPNDVTALNFLSAFPLGRVDPSPPQSFALRYADCDPTMSLRAWPSRTHIETQDTSTPPGGFTLTMFTLSYVVDASDGLIDLLRLFNLHAVVSLSVSTTLQQFKWTPILPLFGAVTSISLFDSHWPHLVRSLTTFSPSEMPAIPGQTGDVQGMTFLCPRLHELRFAQRHSSGPQTVDALFFEMLAILLELRRAGGVTVQVVVQDESLSITELRDLRALKRKRVWRFVKQ